MKRLNKENAIHFLEKYFSLFVTNYIRDGYKIKISFVSNNSKDTNFFFVRFVKGKEHTRNFKIIFN